ncbi:MAG: aromatic ring-hydroxylating dioxygenase subunit alpha [Acidobacteria bacterium]|nr:aromatic ring-hydroxylating dioxygenase subunit alpha [Acidobacteriota bacterium]
MSIFFVDPDIRKAKTLGSEFYTDAAYFELSKAKIFSRTWQFLGRKDEVESLRPATILPGFLDEPVLLVNSDDSLKCLSNVCTHRGKILVEEPCKADLIRCGYHGRRFSLDGKFLSMPEFESVTDFPCESDDLWKLAFAERQGFIFASLDPVEPFESFVDDAAARFADDNYDSNALRLTSTREYQVNAHWALYCENYLEGFHIPYVHQALNAVVDYGTYTTETFRYSSLQTGYDNAGEVAARYLFIFPNLMFNFYPWGISLNVVRPVTPSKTVVEFLTYVSDESLLEKGAGADLHGVEIEDEAVVESVQRGIRSRFYSRGRYSPTREQGTHHFHRLIAEFMSL